MPNAIILEKLVISSIFIKGKSIMLMEKASPALNITGIVLLSKTGMLIIIAVTRRKIRKNT